MPELPEVEEVRRSLEPFLIGRRVIAAELRRRDFLSPAGAKLRDIVGASAVRTYRHGKKLLIEFKNGITLMLHLGMSGRVQALPAAAPLLPHTHVILSLADGNQIRLVDPRRFGGLWLYPDFATARAKELAMLGPDALTLTPQHLAHWRQARGAVKARLLSQRDVAGLGNIYVDEALFRAEIHPQQQVNRISASQIEQLVAAIHGVLGESLRLGGTTLRDYRNVTDQPGEFVRRLRAYGRGGLPCLNCGVPMMTRVISGRTTVWCKKCQKLRR